ncbi:MAG: putative methyltransferase [Aeromicrobium sp.]|nr:putative methyltransferase [Aeromicrobium sp.]
MTPYVDDHAVASTTFGVTMGLWAIVELRQAIRRRPEATKADRHSLDAVRLTLFAGWLIAAASRALIPGATIRGGVVMFAIGFVIAWAGIGLRTWAIASLGSLFTIAVMTSADQRVVDSGPYRYVRHPSYSGLILILVGAAIMFGNWFGVAAIVVIPTLGLLTRIRVEERAMVKTLGTAYEDFADGRKRLIPYVW